MFGFFSTKREVIALRKTVEALELRLAQLEGRENNLVEAMTNDPDFLEMIGQAVEEKVDNMNISELVDEAMNNIDLTDQINDAIEATDFSVEVRTGRRYR